MLKRPFALKFLTDVLWNMLTNLKCTNGHDKDMAFGIILDIEPDVAINKLVAIKTLSDWVNCEVKLSISSNMGAAIRKAMVDTSFLHYSQDNHLRFRCRESTLGLKEAMDFVNLMEAILANTEAKTF